MQPYALAARALRGDTIYHRYPYMEAPSGARIGSTSQEVNTRKPQKNNSFELFPNPSNGRFTLKLDAEIENLRVSVYDLTGRNVYEFQWRDQSKAQTLSLQHLSNGVYYVQVRSGNQFFGVKPIVIQP